MSRSIIKLVTALGTIIILFLAGFFGVWPLVQQYNFLQNDIQNQQLRQDMIKTDLEALRSEQDNLTALRQEVEDFERAIPLSSESGELIRHLNEIALEHEVVLNELTVMQPVELSDVAWEDSHQSIDSEAVRTGLYQSEIYIDIRGEYQELLAFLDTLQRSERLIIIRNVSVDEPSNRGFKIQGSIYQLSVPTLASTETVPPQPEPEETQP